MVKEFLISLLHYFVDITTAVLIAAAIYLTISDRQPNSTLLWEILLSGFITALPSAVLLCFDQKSVKKSVLLWGIHFILIYFITLMLIKMFGWCRITPMSVFLTFVAVVFIYFFTCLVHYLVDRKHTALMNQQLKKRYVESEKKE
jgi:CHASE2 domain-containing sensor protein